MNAGIILQGQAPDIIGNVARGAQAQGQMLQGQRANRLNTLYQEQGAGIAAGDQNALNALAQIDPTASLGIQESRLGMQATQEQMAQRRAAASRQAAQFAQAGRAEEAAALMQEQDRLFASAGAITSPEQWDQFMAANGGDEFVGQFGNRQVILAGHLAEREGFAEGLEFAQGGGAELPAPAQALQWRAEQAGLQPGSPEYQEFILNGGGDPATFRALQMQALAAGYAEGSPEYNNFMATRGAGEARAATLGADIDLGGAAAQAEDIGEASAAAGVAAWEAYGRVQSGLGNIDEAIAAIDRGANSGLIYNMMPRISEEGASLQNSMDRMGLDVVGSVTFGALSEGELRLAMSTAVPRGLGPDELRTWLVRRRDAQEATAGMLSNAAQFLTVPGNTINDWIAQNSTQGSASASGAPSGGAQDFSVMSADDLLGVDIGQLSGAALDAFEARWREVRP